MGASIGGIGLICCLATCLALMIGFCVHKSIEKKKKATELKKMTPKVGTENGPDQLPNLKGSEPDLEESGRQPLASAFATMDN